MYKITFKKLFIVFIVSFLFAIILGFYLKNQNLKDSFDYRFMKLFQENNVFLKNGISFFIVKSITFLGDTITYFIFGIPILIFLTIKREYEIIYSILFSIFVAYLLNEAMKKIVGRIRPIEFWRFVEIGKSYPSGHSMVGASFYMTLGYIVSEKKSKKYRYIFTALAMLIAFSRVVLGVHWLTDIVVGFWLGYLCHCLSIRYFNFRRSR